MTRAELREIREDEFLTAVGQVYEAQYKDLRNKIKRFHEENRDE